MYQHPIINGPFVPTNSANLPPKRIISNKGLVKLLKKFDKEDAHLSISVDNT